MILALSGPICIGKTYAKESIQKVHPEVKEIYVYTTRKVSPTERHVKHLSVSEFDAHKHAGNLVLTYESYGEQYGFNKEDFTEKNGDYVVILPANLVSAAKKLNSKIVSINFVIDNSELDLLGQRIKQRYANMSNGEIKGRLLRIKKEIEAARAEYLTYDVSVLVSKEYERHFGEIVVSLYDNFAKKK